MQSTEARPPGGSCHMPLVGMSSSFLCHTLPRALGEAMHTMTAYMGVQPCMCPLTCASWGAQLSGYALISVFYHSRPSCTCAHMIHWWPVAPVAKEIRYVGCAGWGHPGLLQACSSLLGAGCTARPDSPNSCKVGITRILGVVSK